LLMLGGSGEIGAQGHGATLAPAKERTGSGLRRRQILFVPGCGSAGAHASARERFRS
jgi:hypothetical protein